MYVMECLYAEHLKHDVWVGVIPEYRVHNGIVSC